MCGFTVATGLGVVDYLTGRELVVSPLYLFPICWVTWSVGRSAGVALAIFSTMIWLAGDYLSGFGNSHPVIPMWNALMLAGMFLPSVYLLAAFQRAHVHLEATVTSRTVALQNEIKERKLAESAKIQAERLATVGMMAAQVAHEVRNPLGAITLTLDLLDEDLRKMPEKADSRLDESAELVSEMREEVRRIDRVILDYLVLARPRKSSLEPLDLNALIHRKLTFMQGVIIQAGTSLVTNFAKVPLLIRADGDQLWQAVLNLIKNGLEAMPEGGTLRVETTVEQDTAVLRLTDTGCGMTAVQKQTLFVPFVTSKAHGTGLGLTLVYQIITEHNGRIECRSAPGEGTTFTVILPLETSPPRENRQRIHQTSNN